MRLKILQPEARARGLAPSHEWASGAGAGGARPALEAPVHRRRPLEGKRWRRAQPKWANRAAPAATGLRRFGQASKLFSVCDLGPPRPPKMDNKGVGRRTGSRHKQRAGPFVRSAASPSADCNSIASAPLRYTSLTLAADGARAGGAWSTGGDRRERVARQFGRPGRRKRPAGPAPASHLICAPFEYTSGRSAATWTANLLGRPRLWLGAPA